jgi:hypothetical protein
LKRHLFCGAVAALLLGLPLLWALETSIPYRVTQTFPISDARSFAPVEMPELPYLRTRDGQSTYRLRLAAIHLERLVKEPNIELRVTDYGQTRAMLSAELTIPSANCAFAAHGRQAFPTNAWLTFVRQQTCAQIRDAADELVLTIRLAAPGNVAVWAAGRGNSAPTDVVLVVNDRTRAEFVGRALIGAVWHSDNSRAASRLALLSYVWQVSRSALVVLMAGAVAFVGLSAAMLSYCYATTRHTGRSLTPQSSLAGAAAALALAVIYACVVPPLQAADEPNHFVGLSHSLKRPQLAGESTRLGQLGHLDRIAFHPDEHFNPADVGYPNAGMLLAGGEPESDVRGRGVYAVWDAFAPVLRRTRTVGGTLLLARVLNAGVFASTVGLFVCIVARFTSSRWPVLDAFPLFIIPTLPFFGMYVSNYAPLCAVYILFAGGIVVFVRDDLGSYVSGPLMGLAWAAGVLLSRSAFSLAPVLVACAAARMILGPQLTTWSRALVFWMGLAVPAAIAFSMIPAHLFDIAQATATGLPVAVQPFWKVIQYPWLLLPIGVIASAAEIRFHGSGRVKSETSRRRLETAVVTVGYAAAILLATSIAVSAVIQYPFAPMLDLRHLPSTRSYVVGTLLPALTMFRFGHADFLTSQSFWTGYGWLDTFLPAWLVTMLTVSTGTSFVITLLWIARMRAYRIGFSCFLLIAALVAAFAAAAFSVLRATPGDLHGRYLLGIYLCLVLLCWHWLTRIIPHAGRRTKAAVLVTCSLCVIMVHGLAFATILSRYFG